MRSKDLIRLVEREGWVLRRVRGSHHQFKHPAKPGLVTIPHRKKDVPQGTVKSILHQAGIDERSIGMKYAVVVHHDEGSAYGVSVPDLPGCFSAGDTFDEALENVVEAIEFHLEGLAEEGMDIPRAEPIDAHLDNPDYADGTWGFVDIDLTPYLGKTEKINVTLPSAVIRKIDAKHKNRSRFLAEAALKALG